MKVIACLFVALAAAQLESPDPFTPGDANMPGGSSNFEGWPTINAFLHFPKTQVYNFAGMAQMNSQLRMVKEKVATMKTALAQSRQNLETVAQLHQKALSKLHPSFVSAEPHLSGGAQGGLKELNADAGSQANDDGLCARDYSSACPRGWTGGNGNCEAPAGYEGPCNNMDFGSSAAQKSNNAKQCKANFPCGAGDSANYYAACPQGWSENNGNCEGSPSGADCPSSISADMDAVEREEFALGTGCASW